MALNQNQLSPDVVQQVLYRPTYRFGKNDQGQWTYSTPWDPSAQPFDPQQPWQSPVSSDPQFVRDWQWTQRNIQWNQPGGPLYDPDMDASLWYSMPNAVIMATALGMGAAGAAGASAATAGAGGLSTLGANPGTYWSALQAAERLAQNPSGGGWGSTLGGLAGTVGGALLGVPGGGMVGGLAGGYAGNALGGSSGGGGSAMANGDITNPDGSFNWAALVPILTGLVGGGLGISSQLTAQDRAQQAYQQQQQLFQMLMQMATQYQGQLGQYNQQQQDVFGQRGTDYQAMRGLIDVYNQQQQGVFGQREDDYQHAKSLIDQYNQQQQQALGQKGLDYNAERQLIDLYNQQRQQGYTQQQADYNLMRSMDIGYMQQQQAYNQSLQATHDEQAAQVAADRAMNQAIHAEQSAQVAQDRAMIQATLAKRNEIAGRLADPTQVMAGAQQMLNPFLRGVEGETTQAMARNLAGQGVTSGGAYQRAVAQALIGQLAPYYQQAEQNYVGSQQAALGGYSYAPTGELTPFAPTGELTPYMPAPMAPGGLPQVPVAPQPGMYPQVPGIPQPELYQQAPSPFQPAAYPQVPSPVQPLYGGSYFPTAPGQGMIPGYNPYGSSQGGLGGAVGGIGTALTQLARVLGLGPQATQSLLNNVNQLQNPTIGTGLATDPFAPGNNPYELQPSDYASASDPGAWGGDWGSVDPNFYVGEF